MSRALFVIGGFGLGNSTRCGALIEELHSQGLTVDVATSSNGLWYFAGSKHVQNLIPLAPLAYTRNEGGISFLRTVLDAPKLIKNLIANAVTIVRLQKQNHYSFIATDSEYSPFLAKLFLFAPLVTINNVFFTFSDTIRKVPRSRRWQVWPALVIEYFDLLIQKNISDYRIAPVLKPSAGNISSRTLYCPPLVRRELYGCTPSNNLERALVVASGSGIGVSRNTVESVARCENVKEVYVVGLEGESHGKITYLGRQKDISSYMAKADFIVSNGGFSTISEALISRRPILIIPIENHFEQIQNGRFIESLGLGIVTNDEQLENDLARISLERFIQNEDLNLNGAEVAATALLSLGTQNEFSYG